MRVRRWSALGWTSLIVGCATGGAIGGAVGGATATNLLTPLGAHLTADAKTGAPIPLRHDPNARVILSSAAGLPPASFQPAQAARGEKVFGEVCASCHQTSQMIGQTFVDNWNDRRVYDFYALVRGTMPLDHPGELKEQEYIDVVAYLMQANHQASPGTDSLAADTVALRAHKIAVHP